MNRKLLAAVVAIIIVACAAIVAVNLNDERGGGSIVVETSPDFAPFDYYYGDEFAGIDMDVIRAVCKEIGYSVEFRQNAFDSILMSVQQKKCDFGASGFTINDERKLQVNFSESYATVKQVAVVLKDSTIDSLEDIKGKKLTVQTGTTGADYAETVSSDIVYQKAYADVVLDVLNGKADAEIVDDMVAQSQIAAHPELEIRDILTDAETEYYGFIFSKDNKDLYTLFNDALKKLIDNGTVQKIIDYYVENGCSADTPPYSADTKTIVVETSPDFPPYEYLFGTEYAGIDMDIVRAVCKDLGYEVEFRQNDFDSIILSVQQGKCDMGASGFTISDERKEQVNFSDPYASIRQVAVVLKDSSISTADDIKGARISVQTGTTGAELAEDYTDAGNISFQKSFIQAMMDVKNGKVDCEIVDSVVAEAQVKENPDLKILDILDSDTEYYGFIFSKSNTELLEAFNSSLAKLKDDGTIDKILEYYVDHDYSTDTPSYYSQTSKGTITVETSPDFPPYEYLLGTEYAGIDMDIVRAICKDLGYDVVFKQNDFDSIILSVQQGKANMGASGFTISEERKLQVNFSDPYATVKQVAVVKKNSTFNTIDDIMGARISVQTGTTGAALAEDFTDIDNISFQKSFIQAMMDVQNGKVDCEFVDSVVAEAQVQANPDLRILDVLDADIEYYGFIFAKENTELLEAFNSSLQKLKDDGTIDKIITYYAEHYYSTDTPSYYDQDSGDTTDEGGSGFWKRFKKDFIDNDRYSYIFKGLKNTIMITLLALVIGLVIGALVAMIRSTHDQTGRFFICDKICRFYITVIRGTPVMVQLLIIYYVVFASVNLNQILIAGAAFGLNSGAYVAEVFSSGINSVPKGQMEACRSLGMNNSQSMKKVIMPQALRNILPALGNEGISLLKETSVAGYIGVMDLTRAGDIIRGQTYDALLPLLVVAIIYLAIVLVLTYLIKRLERRLNNAY